MSGRPVAGVLSARTGLALLVAAALVALLAPVLTGYGPSELAGPSLAPPGRGHWLGTNDVGQDIFTRLVFGTRVSLLVGASVAGVATLIGTLIGMSAGYFEGRVDAVLMRIVDLILVLPFLPLLIILQVFLGAGLPGLIAVLALVMWAGPARELRSRVLTTRSQVSVQAAIAMGASAPHVFVRHLLPDLVPLVVPQVVRIARAAILAEASLSFLGLGDPTVTSWGAMLFHAHARSAYLTGAWVWWILPPGLAIGLVVLAVAMIGYWFEERSRPRLSRGWGHAAHARSTVAREAASAMAGDPGEASPVPLRVRGLRVDYGPGTPEALTGLSLEVAEGEALGVVGESGGGKSTLALCVLGLLHRPGRIRGGSVEVGGIDLGTLRPGELRELRGRRVALVPQGSQSALNPVRSARWQVSEALAAHGVPRTEARQRADALLSSVGLDAARQGAFPHELSGGMRQRVLIAMALANDPELLVADEPTSGLDVLARREVLRVLAGARERRKVALVVISHDLDTVLGLADRVAVIRRGELVEAGPPAQLSAAPRHPYTKTLLAAAAPDSADRSMPSAWSGRGDDRGARHEPVLRLIDVHRRYSGRSAGPVRAVDGVSLNVHRGERVGLVGASGAGKSTLARLVVGLERPDQGSVVLAGSGPSATEPNPRRARARSAQIIFQDPYAALPAHLSVAEIVAEPLAIHGIPVPERLPRVVEALTECELDSVERVDRRYPHELSGGERQRVALARALVLRPRILVADEPASMLDAPLRYALLDLLARLSLEHEMALVHITHDLPSAARICERIVVLHEGRVVEDGPSARVMSAARSDVARRLIEAAGRGVA